MKKSYSKLSILFLIYSLFFLLLLWGVKQFTFNRWYASEVDERASLLFTRPFNSESNLWQQRINQVKKSAKIIRDLLQNSTPDRRFSYDISGNSLRYFVEDKDKQFSMGVYAPDKNITKNEISRILQGFPALKDHFLEMNNLQLKSFFISKDNWIAVSPGTWISGIEDGYDLIKQVAYQSGIAIENPAESIIITGLYYDSIWKKWMLGLLVPIYINFDFRGIVGHNIIVDKFLTTLDCQKYMDSNQLFLLNQDFELIHHRDLLPYFDRNDFKMNQRFTGEKKVTDFKTKAVIERLKEEVYTTDIIELNNKKYFSMVRQIPVLGWYYVFIIDQNKFIGHINAGANQFMLIVFLIFLLFVLMFFLFFRISLFKPIKSLIRNLSQFKSLGAKDTLQYQKTHFSPLNDLFKEIENVIGQLNSNVKEIAESKEYIETLMKTVQVFIIVLNNKLKPIYMNEYALNKLDINKEDISSLNIFNYIDKPFLKDMSNEFVGKDNILNKETFMILKSGRKIGVDISMSKLFNTADELIGYIAVVDDITKRKKAEINLRNQIAFSRQIFKAIPDMIMIFDTHLEIVFYNQRAEKIIKNSAQAERSISAFLSDESLEKGFDETLRNIIDNTEYIKQINVMNPFKGGVNYVDLIIEPLQTASGIIGGLIIMRDISEWRNLSEKIRILQAFTGRLIDASPFAVISVNEFDKIKVWNKAAENLFEISGKNAIDQNLFEINPFFLSYKDVINEVKILGKTFFLSDQKMDLERESTAVLNLNFYQVQSEGRNVVINIEDMSQIRELEDSLLQAQKMESLGLLTSGIIHDFNNILSGIIGYAALLDKKFQSDSEVKKYTSNIIDYSERASGMIRQILGFSKKRLSKKEVLDINQVIEGLLNFLKVGLKNIKIEKRFSREKIQLLADKTKLSQVIINLMINAREALEQCSDPTIIVTTDEVFIKGREDILDGVYAKIDISDNGQGIKKENLDKIFEPFFSTKDKEKSTGIGLATVKDIVRDFHGKITVKSEYKRGTTFSILIPAVKEEVFESSEEIKKKLETTIEGAVLLVDDEKVIREIGGEMLETLGIKCFTAAEGNEAVDIFKEKQDEISLVILDIEMPGYSGDRVAKKLKKINPEVRILFSSGYTRDYLESKVFKEKIEHFIPKPFNLNQLSEKLDRLMRE